MNTEGRYVINSRQLQGVTIWDNYNQLHLLEPSAQLCRLQIPQHLISPRFYKMSDIYTVYEWEREHLLGYIRHTLIPCCYMDIRMMTQNLGGMG